MMITQLKLIKRYAVIVNAVWTLMVVASFLWFSYQQNKNNYEIAKAVARIAFQKDSIYRKWAATHGGVYVPVTPETPPNPYLANIPERDISTPSGKLLTLVNPAYMTRQVFELATKEENFVRGHITSLNPLRHENAPDEWEQKALKSFESGNREASEVQVVNGQVFLRLMRPFFTEQPCLKCHAAQGYKIGNVRGGISVSVPMSLFSPYSGRLSAGTAFTHFIIWVLGVCTVNFSAGKLSRSSAALHEQNLLLENEISERVTAQNKLEKQASLLAEEINERKHVEDTLRESNERFFSAFENAPTIMAISSLEGSRCLDVNQSFVDAFGFSRDELIGNSFIELGIISQSERKKILEAIEVHGRASNLELTYFTKSGKHLILNYYGQIIPVAGEKRLLSIALDITEQRRIEQQYYQSQKMESIGRLAGGVAHDFNNMLSIIIGQAELSLMQIEQSDPRRGRLEQILDAANRSAEITSQLLAFSRNQTIEPRVLDLNATVSGMLNMLRRLIGEDIDLTWNPGHGLRKVKIDPSRFDQIMANLCVNARDAVDGVGTIDIQTGNVSIEKGRWCDDADIAPGEYVMISVSDNGCGMSRDVMEHIFEPFYTTKEVGRGTGLGLATVFGIVRQSGGNIKVYSEPGQGTTFRIYFPAVEDKAGARVEEETPLTGGSETVLVVEDEPAIMRLTTDMLSILGYTVYSANSPEEARVLAEKYKGEIDLLITDMIMPGMNGRDLSEQLLIVNPAMKRLFMSGYTANVMAKRCAMENDMHFLQKPFTIQLLAAKVREALQGC